MQNEKYQLFSAVETVEMVVRNEWESIEDIEQVKFPLLILPLAVLYKCLLLFERRDKIMTCHFLISLAEIYGISAPDDTNPTCLYWLFHSLFDYLELIDIPYSNTI